MLPPSTKVYFAVQPADLRRTFDGLAAMAMSALGQQPASGGLFVFTNKRGDQVRLLFKDQHGWCILAKRLDAGRFRRPQFENGIACWETEIQTLLRFLEDIDLDQHRTHSIPRKTRSAPPRLSVVEPSMQ